MFTFLAKVVQVPDLSWLIPNNMPVAGLVIASGYLVVKATTTGILLLHKESINRNFTEEDFKQRKRILPYLVGAGFLFYYANHLSKHLS